MKDTNLVILKSDLAIIIARAYRLVDVEIVAYENNALFVVANFPKKRKKK